MFKAFLIGALILISACAQKPFDNQLSSRFDTSINSRSIVKLAPGVFMVRDPLRLSFGPNYEPIVVPEGFIMDLASIPKIARAIEDRADESMAPAIVHDYLYWYQTCSRSEADAVMLLAMSSLNVGELKAPVIYQAVSDFGKAAFDENRERRQQGYQIRTLTADGIVWARERPYSSYRKLDDILDEAQRLGYLLRSEVTPRDIQPTCKAVLAACKSCSTGP